MQVSALVSWPAGQVRNLTRYRKHATWWRPPRARRCLYCRGGRPGGRSGRSARLPVTFGPRRPAVTCEGLVSEQDRRKIMFISNVRRRAAALLTAGAAAAAVLALAAPAGGVTGTRWISPQQAGYTATGAKFKTITAHVYLRNPAQYAGMAASYGHSVQLWSPGVVATVGVTASTSGTAYMPYATIYDRTTRQVIASNPNPHWCDSRDKCGENIGDPVPAGADLLLKIEYSHFSPTNSSV